VALNNPAARPFLNIKTIIAAAKTEAHGTVKLGETPWVSMMTPAREEPTDDPSAELVLSHERPSVR